MSDTETAVKKYTPRPYFNVANMAKAEAEEFFDHKKNPNGTYGQSKASPDTQDGNHDATSEDTTDYKKRWIDLKKHYDTEVSDLRRQLSEKEKVESFTPPKTAEELEDFRKQHPDFYDVMMTVAHDKMNQYDEGTSSRLRQLEEKLAQAEQEKAFVAIAKSHPDYLEVVNDPKFLEWIDTQDASIQSWVKENSTNASLFISAIDLYKLNAGITKKIPKRESIKETKHVNASAADSVSVSGNSITVGDGGKRIWTREEIQKVIAQGKYSQYEAELDEAMAEGRIRN